MCPPAELENRKVVPIGDGAHTELEHEFAGGGQIGGRQRDVAHPDVRSMVIMHGHGTPVSPCGVAVWRYSRPRQRWPSTPGHRARRQNATTDRSK